jgi:uncharacterized RDD family membrane protein YckC
MTNVQNEDLLVMEESYVRASTGKRFANYLIDLVIFYILIFFFGIIIALVSPSFLEGIGNDSPGNNLIEQLVFLVIYAVYMSIVEALFKGKSIGKLITKTRAVNLDGSRISTSTAFARGFSRAVPFCVFSAFGTPSNPWQDRWTNTMVINESNQQA